MKKIITGGIIIPFFLVACTSRGADAKPEGRIDRHTIVSRNDIIYTKPELAAPVSVGNGHFAFTVDVTGLQTFADAYDKGFCLGTMAEYGWHSTPTPQKYSIADSYKAFDSHGRQVLYPFSEEGAKRDVNPAAKWLFMNPTRMTLGRIGLVLSKADGSAPVLADLHNVRQHLELWTGWLTSSFELEGQPVTVRTMVHPEQDIIAVRIESPLIKAHRLKLRIAFPYANTSRLGAPDDWTHPELHTTKVIARSATRVDFSRQLDNEDSTLDDYACAVTFQPGDALAETATHTYELTPGASSGGLDCAVTFAPKTIPAKLPTVAQTQAATADYWKDYWSKGGFVDLSASKDPRWRELERRIILSQYVLAVNCAGSLPPQECGLVQKSWYGKFHMEMVWFHEAHFALWGRLPLMMRSMDIYQKLLPSSRERAQLQGYKGARWPKMTSPEGVESPGAINPFLVWQQPHPVYFAELDYRQNPTKKTLLHWWEVVQASADFMATFVVKDGKTGIYDVGPPLNDVHEHSEIGGTKNAPFEVAYFRYSLNLARQWRERLGLKPDPLWDDVVKHLAPPGIKDGKYDAPTIELALIPLNPDLDRALLDKTVELKAKHLPKASCSWGYFVAAMAAARTGHPDWAVEALLFDSPCATVSSAGYNFWKPTAVPVYLPGNGSLLSAVAMMAGGWDGAPKRNAPGFPDNGQWVVKSEGLQPLP